MESTEPGNNNPFGIIDKFINNALHFFSRTIDQGLDSIEYANGIGRAITDLPKGIIDVGAYFLLQEPGKEGYQLQINKKHLLRGINDIGKGVQVVKYMSKTDKEVITQKIVRLHKLYTILCFNRKNIGFSKTMKQDYLILNRIRPKRQSIINTHADFVKVLLKLILSDYRGKVSELHNDMAIIRRSIDHQNSINTDPEKSAIYNEHCTTSEYTQDSHQDRKSKRALLVLMEEIEHYPFNSVSQKHITFS